MQPEVFTAEITSFVYLTLLAVSLAMAAAALSKQKKAGGPKDTRPTTLTERGAYVPLIIGRGKAEPVFAWAGKRKIRQETPRGTGKGIFDVDIKQDIYWESGWHLICVGPAQACCGIYIDGEKVVDEFTHLDYPSGSVINVPGHGNLRWYWGEAAQPINSILADAEQTGVPSMYPYLCHAVWENRRLGPHPTWKNTWYDMVVQDILKPSQIIPDAVNPDLGRGMNGYYILHQLCTARYPHGVGAPETFFDLQSLKEVGDILHAEGLAQTVNARGGVNSDNVISNVMLDAGVGMVEVDGVISFVAFRENDDIAYTVPVLSNDDLVLPESEELQVHDERRAESVAFKFENRHVGFKDSYIDVHTDGIASEQGRRKPEEITLDTVTSPTDAVKVAARRQYEILKPPAGQKITLARANRDALPTQFYDKGGKRFQIADLKLGFGDSPEVKINLLESHYHDANIAVDDNTTTGGTRPAFASALRWRVIEVPFALGSGTGSVLFSLLRSRANSTMEAGRMHASLDGLTYELIGQQSASCIGGALAEDYVPNQVNNTIQENGPLVTIDDNDVVTEAPDLSTNRPAWRSGQFIAIINNEVLFVQSLEFVTGNDWRMKNVIRHRFDTELGTHVTGDDVYMFDIAWLGRFGWSNAQAQWLTAFKNQEVRAPRVEDLATVTPQNLFVTERSLAPLPPTNFKCGRNGYWDNRHNIDTDSDGGSFDIGWTPRTRDASAAGVAAPGVPVSVQSHEGDVEIQLWSDVGGAQESLRETRIVSADTRQIKVAYTQREAWHNTGTPPTPYSDSHVTTVKIRAVEGGKASPWQTITMGQFTGGTAYLYPEGDYI